MMDLTRGPIRSGLLRFCLPLVAGNLLQQMYNVVDTWVVGRYVGQNALAAVGGAFSLLVLLSSVVLGLCMGSGVVFSQLFGMEDREGMRRAMGSSLWICAGASLALTGLSLCLLPRLLLWMRVPQEVHPGMSGYLMIVLPGILPTCAYNYLAAARRSVGDSVTPLAFLAVSAVINMALDVVLVACCGMGVGGAAWATLIAQLISALGMLLYCLRSAPELLPARRHLRPDGAMLRRIASVSALTSLQQSVMNLGILMVQSLVNSFGAAVMAGFAVGVKVDAFAYAPAQDFANGYATFVSQNLGAGRGDRVRQGMRDAMMISCVFCAVVSLLVCLFARQLMSLFITPGDADAVRAGVRYLRIEGMCYVGIGVLFLLYATFRGLERAGVSLLLTLVSLGLRVALAYAFAPVFGTDAIWWSIPIGWLAADVTGLALLRTRRVRMKTGRKCA